MSTASLPMLMNTLPLGSLDAYIYRVNQIPMLSAEEEHDLGMQLFEQQNLAAARQLVMSHLRFVVKIARGYKGYGLAQADLIQEGNVGLMKAVKRFNPHVGVRLVSFAVHWIRAEIHDFILKNWRIVKVATTKAQRKLFFNLRQFKNRLGWFTQEEVSDVAKTLGVSTKDVLEMESRLNAHDLAFDTPGEDEDDTSAYHALPAGYLADPQANPADSLEATNWGSIHQEKLQQALEHLDERARVIIETRWLHDDKATLHDLAARYGVSAERIRQLEAQALQKLKKAVLAEVA